tara:strand:- start:53 stop:427 length:375 start_codon:yes stop_codon:yes gene_type:complete
MKKFIFIYILMTMLFGEETLTLTETEVNNLFNQIRTLEIADSLNTIHVNELNSTITLYKKLDLEHKLLVQDKDSLHVLLKQENELLLNRIDEISPKWYDNKWIWFTLGVVCTGSSIHLAGQIVN